MRSADEPPRSGEPSEADVLSGKVRVLRDAVTAGSVSPDDVGFFFDFDGTLAPIQDEPRTVQPTPGVTGRLKSLANLAGKVAIVSARPVGFLRSRFPGIPALRFFGLYGLESGDADGVTRTHPSAEPYMAVMGEIARRAGTELPPQTGVEHKRVMVALHYRRSPEVADGVVAWAEARARQYGLHVQHGRMVCELRPPGVWDKGSILAEESAGLASVWYFGDDLGDIPAFEALTRLESDRPGFVSVRVVVASGETGGRLDRFADSAVRSSVDVPVYLDMVLSFMSRGRRRDRPASPVR